MKIEDVIRQRGITRVLHFTTTESGLLGILAKWAVKSRARLPKEKYLEYVYVPNASIRRDPEWLDYVNLSVQRINSIFFDICANRWHADRKWCVLSFKPEILTHADVVFTTTNNIYPYVVRGQGVDGLEQMFYNSIRAKGNTIVRAPSIPANEPTCRQAEVLYPRELSMEFIDCVYLADYEQYDELRARLHVLDRPKIAYYVDSSAFT